MEEIGKGVIGFGILIVLIGGGLILIAKVPGLGRLPGDIVIQRDNFSCVFPLVTSIVLSIVLTIALNVLLRLISK